VAQERSDTDLVLATRAGDAGAFGILFDRWFDRVWDVAWHVVRDREVAAEVAQDAFLAAWQGIDDLREPAAFGGWLLRTSRNRALNRLERERRTTPAGGTEDPVMAALPGRDPDPAAALDDHSHVELVWAAAAALGERDISVLDLHLRHGLTPAEIAEELDVAPNHAHQLLFRLRERLAGAIRSWVLWRHGLPRCADLRAALAGAGIAAFSADAARIIGRHAGDCEACTADRDEVLAPERLFAAVPIALAPPLLKAQAAAALEAGGVPMAGSEHAGRGPTGRRRRPWRGMAAVAAAVVVTLGLVVALAGRAGDGDLNGAAIDATSSTSTAPGTSRAGTTPPGVPSTTTLAPTSTSVDAGTGTSAGSTAPPATPPPTTVPPTTATTQPPAPPTIGGFRASLQRGACEQALPGTAVVWQSSGGTTHSIGAPDGSVTAVGTGGSQVFCPHQPGTWTLTVTGPGGTATATASA
jgi:RNA polymerase sigma factor (sigma-70 family)